MTDDFFGPIRGLGQDFPPIAARPLKVPSHMAAPLAGALTTLASVQESEPQIRAATLHLFAASHAHMAGEIPNIEKSMKALEAGKTPLTKILGATGSGLRVLDLAVSRPAADPCQGLALTPREVAGTFAFGMEATAAGGDILPLGAIAPGAEDVAALVLKALLGLQVSLDARQSVAFDRHGEMGNDPFALIAAYGGRELAALTGAIAAARALKLAVLTDGLAAATAALICAGLWEGGADHVIIGTLAEGSIETSILDALGRQALMRAPADGGGSGAGLALALLQAGCAALKEPQN